MNKVSVLIPIYNVEKYLSQCIDSVLQQTLYDIEIICINDGSTDHSLEILQDYAREDCRIKIIDKKNTGYGHSMNVGLKEASGEYIGIVESDDFAEPNMFENLYLTAIKHDVDIVKSNYYAQKGDTHEYVEPLSGEKYNVVYNPSEVENVLYGITPCIWSAIYKREFLLKNNIFFNETPGASYQDVSFYLKTLVCAKNIYLKKEAYLHYRIDNVNSSVRSKEKIKCIFDEFLEIKNFLKNHVDFRQIYPKLIPAKVLHYMGNYKRVDDKYKMLFLSYMAIDFSNDNEEGLLMNVYPNMADWAFIQQLIHHKEQAFWEAYVKRQKEKLCLDGLLLELQKNSNIYIYGAGKVGAFVSEYLFQKNIIIKGFVVSSLKNNCETLNGIKVSDIESLEVLEKEDLMILVALKDANQYEVICSLKEKGFVNIMSMNFELREAMI